jgi:hypothetical protein
MVMTSKDVEQFEKQTREMLRAQQNAYVAAVKAWREAVAAATEAGLHPPPAPAPAPFDIVPTPTEMAEATYGFAAKLLADQSRFMEELAKAMSAPTKKT